MSICCKCNETKELELPYVLIRTYSAGVHFGYLFSREGKEVTLINSRRIWKWAGAATLSQIAMEGCKKPDECKISMEVDQITLTEAIEIILISKEAKHNLKTISAWKE
jgi:hypothetical protein